MTQLAEPQRQKKALDIGTGSGYQAAVLAELVESVHSIEIVEPLAEEAARASTSAGIQQHRRTLRRRLSRLGIRSAL